MWYLIAIIVAFSAGVVFSDKTRAEVSVIEDKLKDEVDKIL